MVRVVIPLLVCAVGCGSAPPAPPAGSPEPEPTRGEAAKARRSKARPTDASKLQAPKPDAPAPATFPDVIVLTLDTTRADHLRTYGYFRDTAPRLEAFAKQAVVFDKLIVPMATTLPTHTSLFTGVYPHEHGVTANVEHGGLQLVTSDAMVSLPTWLSAAGYQTGGFTSCAPLNPTTGIEKGWQVFTAPTGELRPGRITTDDALTWLASTRTDAPILMWVHYYEPHNPYAPDPKHRQAFGEDPQLDAWLDARKVEAVTRRPTGEQVNARPTINAYDAEIRTMDDQVGRVLDALEARGRFDRSLVIVMGDHGEGLNQHGEPGHGLVWDEQLHAPLFIRAPGAAPRRVAAPVSAVDVLPTALGMVDLPDEARFLAQASGVDALRAPPAMVISQSSARQAQFGKAQAYTLREGDRKCRWEEGGEGRVWDLSTDPYELGPGTPDAGCADRIQAAIAAQKQKGGQLGAGGTRKMSDEQRRQLEALGYTEPAGEPHAD